MSPMPPSCLLPAHAPLVIAGGGAAGFMAAITAGEAGLQGVLLLEATAEPLQKVRISGGGRCNVTHACWDPLQLIGHYPRGGRPLLGPFSRFASGDAVAWFHDHGLELVEEADGRLFPSSQRSSSVIHTLRRAAQAAGVQVCPGTALVGVERPTPAGFRCQLRRSGEAAAAATSLGCERLLLATGGHPSGRKLAAALGHTIVPPLPSLFSLSLADAALTALAGVAIDPVVLSLELPGGVGFRQQGAVLITHRGLSGPATLRLTAFAARALQQHGYRGLLRIDWSGGRSVEEVQALLADGRQRQARRQLASWRPWPELSRRLWLQLLAAAGVEPERRWADLRRDELGALVTALTASCYPVTGRGPFGEEFVTAGGVPLGELNLATMESRRVPGLHLAGELVDVDGVTGGFNFQHCWSSGWLAGQAIAAALAPASPQLQPVAPGPT
ncbi:MAG: NAD(P)/FAD-dependent oxidoreductase [Prochlorococcaceae cyanobacterium]